MKTTNTKSQRLAVIRFAHKRLKNKAHRRLVRLSYKTRIEQDIPAEFIHTIEVNRSIKQA